MPMRIIGRGRDAYIVAGYLDKRGRWTPHWSERYFVLTPTNLHYFRKDRDSLFGEERGRISLDRILVKQTMKKNIFEIRYVPNETNDTFVQQVGHAVVHTAQALDPGSIRKHTWILRASKESEAETWINAINDAQHKLTPELLAQANQKLPPIPQGSIVSTKASDTEDSNSLRISGVTNSDHSNKTGLPLQPLISPHSPPSNSPGASGTRYNVPINNKPPITRPNTDISVITRDNNSNNDLHKSVSRTEAVTKSLNTEPLLFVTLEQHNNTIPYTINKSLQSTDNIIVNRNLQSNQQCIVHSTSNSDVIVATLYDGTNIRMPVNYFSKNCSSSVVTFDNTEHSLYNKATVTVKWQSKANNFFNTIKSQDILTILLSIVLPFLVFLTTTYSFYHSNMLNNTTLLHTEHDVKIMTILSLALAISSLYTNTLNLLKLSQSKIITLTYLSCTLPDTSNHKDAHSKYRTSKPTPISVFDVANTTNNNDLLYNSSGSGSQLVNRLPSRPDTMTAAVLKQRAIINRSTRAASSVVENNRQLLNQDDEDERDTNSEEEDNTLTDDTATDDTHTITHCDMDDINTHSDTHTQLPSPTNNYTHTFENESNEQPIVKHDYFGSWTESDWTQIVVRGQNYMNDNKKIPAGPHVFKLNNVHCVYNREKVTCVSERPNSYANQRYQALLQQRGLKDGDKLLQNDSDLLSPLVVVNFIVPLSNGNMGNLILYFTRRIHSDRSKSIHTPTTNNTTKTDTEEPNSAPHKPITTTNNSISSKSLHSPPKHGKSLSMSHARFSPSVSRHNTDSANDITWATGEESGELSSERLQAFDTMFENFITGTDEYRNQRFKLIPKVVDGGWVVRKVVGGKPGIIAKGVPMMYYYDKVKNYFEITIDCAISAIAQRIMGMVNHQAAKLVVDLTILFQGENDEELPEALFGGCRLIHAHLDQFVDIGKLGI